MTLALPAPAPPPRTGAASSAGLRATARIVARAEGGAMSPSHPAGSGGGTTRLPVLDGDGPFALRRVRGTGRQARVCVVGAMSAPLNGDRLALEATAEAGSALRLTSAAATVALPGRAGGYATYDVRLTVGDGARLDWLPEPLISAAGSALRMTTTVELAPTAHLVLREEQVLGRSGEETGALRSRLVVRRAGRTLLDQETAYGPGAPGWDTAAVLDGHRALGQLLVVQPEFEQSPAEVRLLGATAGERADGGAGQGVLAPLAGPGALATAVAPDALRLRRLLDEAARSVAGG